MKEQVISRNTNIDYYPTYEKLRGCQRLKSTDEHHKEGIQARGEGFHIQISSKGTVTITYENKEAFEEAKSILEEYGVPITNIRLNFEYSNPLLEKMIGLSERKIAESASTEGGPSVPDTLWRPDLDHAMEVLRMEQTSTLRDLGLGLLYLLKDEVPSHRLNAKKTAQLLGYRLNGKGFKQLFRMFRRRGIRVGRDYKELFDPFNIEHWRRKFKREWSSKKVEDLEIYVMSQEEFNKEAVKKHENMEILKRFFMDMHDLDSMIPEERILRTES